MSTLTAHSWWEDLALIPCLIQVLPLSLFTLSPKCSHSLPLFVFPLNPTQWRIVQDLFKWHCFHLTKPSEPLLKDFIQQRPGVCTINNFITQIAFSLDFLVIATARSIALLKMPLQHYFLINGPTL